MNSSQRKKEVAEKQIAAYELQIAEQKEEIQKCSVEKFNFQAEITSLKCYSISFSRNFLESNWQ